MLSVLTVQQLLFCRITWKSTMNQNSRKIFTKRGCIFGTKWFGLNGSWLLRKSSFMKNQQSLSLTFNNIPELFMHGIFIFSEISIKVLVELRSRSRSGPGQVRVRRLRFGPEPYSIFGFHPPTPPQTFFLA